MLVQVQQKPMLTLFFKNTITYFFLQNKKLFILVVTSSKGWGVSFYKDPYFLIKEKFVFFFLPYRKSYLTFISIIFLGFQKGYFQYIKLKGIGYKFISTTTTVLLKFGFSHRITYVNSIDTKCYFISRYCLRFETRSLCRLKKVGQYFNSLRKKNIYTKKGIFFKGCSIYTKVSSKKSKF